MEGASGPSEQLSQAAEGSSGSGSDDSDSDSSSDSDSDSDSDSSSGSSSSGSETDNVDDEDYMPPLPEGPAPSREDQARFLELTKPKVPVAPRIQSQPWPQVHAPGMHPSGMPHPGMLGPPGGPINPYGKNSPTLMCLW